MQRRPITKKFKRPEPSRSGGPRHAAHRPAGSKPSLPSGRCVVGIHAVEELLRVRARAVSELWIREKYEEHPALESLFEQAKRSSIRVHVKPPGALDKVVSAHQGVLAFTEEEPELDFQALTTAETATLVALDEVEDPHNLGAVLRTAWLLGVEGILTPEHRAAQLSPAVSKVAQGAVEHVPVVRDGALPQQLEHLKQQGFWVLGLAAEAKQSLYELEIPQKVVWVLGSESGGMRKSVSGVCDDLIGIPQMAPGASFNVSVAAALALGETYRQRQLMHGNKDSQEP